MGERTIGVAIEAAPIAFSVLAEDGRYLAVNRAASSFTGYSRVELLDRRTGDLSADPDRTRAVIEDAFRTGKGHGGASRAAKGPNHHPCAIQARAGAARRRAPHRCGLVAASGLNQAGADDAPEPSLAAYKAQERILGVAFQKAPIAITVTDRSARYRALNGQACITGYSRDELFKLGAWTLTAAPHPLEGSNLTSLDGVREGETEIRTRDGGAGVEFRVATIRVGEEEARLSVWWGDPGARRGLGSTETGQRDCNRPGNG